MLTQQKTSPRQATLKLGFWSRPVLAWDLALQLSVRAPPCSTPARYARALDPMHLARLQRPLQRAAASTRRPFSTVLRPTTTTTVTKTTATITALEERFARLRIASPAAANAAVLGRRYASVKSQGAYRVKSKKTIPKKLGAKKTGGMSRASR